MLITDPDSLNQGTEVVIDTAAKTIQLLTAGNLSTDGVVLQALYSFLKEEWQDNALLRFEFPMQPITDESFEFINGWNLLDDSSRFLIRTGGWAVVDETTGNNTEVWAGIVGLGSIESDDQLYYDQGVGATNVQLTGQVNQAVQVFSDPDADGTPAFDYRTNFSLFVREQGQIFGQASLSDIGVTLMENIVYRFPISTSIDLNITASDAVIATEAPYSGMSITYHETPQTRIIGGVERDFGIVIDGAEGTAEQIYEFVQFQLRQVTDVDEDEGGPTQIGQLQDELLRFVGANLETLSATNADGGGTGVFIDNSQSNDTNRLSFRDNAGASQQFPFVASLSLNFNNNLVAAADAIFSVFFTDANGNDFDDSDAIIVNDSAGVPITGLVGGLSTRSFTFDYDGNVQGGRTPATDAPITVVAIGTDNAQHVLATGTITRSISNSVSLVSPLERNYSNPA